MVPMAVGVTAGAVAITRLYRRWSEGKFPFGEHEDDAPAAKSPAKAKPQKAAKQQSSYSFQVEVLTEEDGTLPAKLIVDRDGLTLALTDGTYQFFPLGSIESWSAVTGGFVFVVSPEVLSLTRHCPRRRS